MASRFVRPETRRLTISDGDWILVRRRLTTGEQRAAFSRMYLAGVDGQLRVNPLQTGLTKVTAYLLDWNLTDEDGQPVEIRDRPLEELEAALDALDPASFQEILDAITAHEKEMADARAQEKKLQAGAPPSSPTSTSPAAVAGATSGSVT